MIRKCPECKTVLATDASSCPKCGLLLGDSATESGRLTTEQEERIVKAVSSQLAGSKKFLWGTSWRTFLFFFSLLGLAFGWGIWSAVQSLNKLAAERFEAMDRNMSNLVAEANIRIGTNISGQFKEPQIRKTVEAVAAKEAKEVLRVEIVPEVQRFREEVNGKLEPLQAEARADALAISTIRKSFEAQASTVNSMTRELAEAKIVVERLKAENERATARLKEMEIYTASIGLLPDGRVKLGGNITGKAWILERGITNLATLYFAGNFKEAYELAKDCVQRHEKSAEAEAGMMRTGDVFITTEGLAQLYLVGALSAQGLGEKDTTLSWTRKALALNPSVESKALLVTALRNKDMEILEIEAQALIKATLDKGGAEAERFKELLLPMGPLNKK